MQGRRWNGSSTRAVLTHLYLDLTKSPLHETNVAVTFCAISLLPGQFGDEHLVVLPFKMNCFYHLSAQPVRSADVQTEQLTVQSLH